MASVLSGGGGGQCVHQFDRKKRQFFVQSRVEIVLIGHGPKCDMDFRCHSNHLTNANCIIGHIERIILYVRWNCMLVATIKGPPWKKLVSLLDLTWPRSLLSANTTNDPSTCILIYINTANLSGISIMEAFSGFCRM